MTAAAARRRSPCLPGPAGARASDGLETLDALLGLVLAAAALSCTYVLCLLCVVSYMRRPAGDGTAGAMPAWQWVLEAGADKLAREREQARETEYFTVRAQQPLTPIQGV